ncbi:unnamed protein product [Rotaria sp. Silwood1]|nr:unnamed protein product [Rotaria sp. Silwood1]CAF4860267.1 unnamed protein product [Rotaria sp. Silwood1]
MATITFAVAKVDVCARRHAETQQLSEVDLARWALKDEKLSLENFQTNYPLVAELNGCNYRIKNAFVGTIYEAYCKHYPLELSVEDIWVAITQGIGIHLNQNAEKYRHLMVSHEGQKELILGVDSLRIPDSDRPAYGNKSVPAIDWSQAVRLMCGLIRDDMKTDMATLLTTPFSGTTPVEQAVFDCTLMDTVKAYYKYRCCLECGIPEVTLRGSPDDFQQVIDRVNQLRTIFTDFHWWLDSLLPHLKQLKASAEGKYICDGEGHYKKVQRNHHHYSKNSMNRIDFDDFSESVTRTDFILDDNGHETKMKFLAGFLGIGQNSKTGALHPCLGWATALPI